jgi:hypothetical protein
MAARRSWFETALKMRLLTMRRSAILSGFKRS